MDRTTLGRWALTMSLLGVMQVGDGLALAATAGHTSRSGGSQADRSRAASKAAPKGQEKADARVPAQPDPAPANVEERLRRGDMEEAIAQGRISDRLDRFYNESERHPERQAAGPPDR